VYTIAHGSKIKGGDMTNTTFAKKCFEAVDFPVKQFGKRLRRS